MKSAIAEAENTEREMRENLLAREHEEQLRFERKRLEQKEELSSKLKNSTQNFPSHSCKQKKCQIAQASYYEIQWSS